MIIAMVVASIGGALVLVVGIRVLAQLVAESSANPGAVTMAAYIGAAVAAIPAFFVSITVGGRLGGGWAEAIVGTSAIPVGVATGMFVVLVGLVLIVSALTASIVRAIRG